MSLRHASAVLGRVTSGSGTLLVFGALLELWAVAYVVWPPGDDIPRHVVLFAGAWLGYALAIAVVLRLSPAAASRHLALIFGIAIVVRGTLLFTSPTLSDDAFRSVWDARIMHAGINPYLYPPGAEELAQYRDEAIWPRVNAPHQRTPYPPLAELMGAVAYAALPERPVAFQGLAAIADLLSAGLLAWLLHRVGVDPRRSIVVAWSPAGALHFAHSGHNDSLMVALVIGAVLLLTFGRRSLAMMALAGAAMVKAVPLLSGPAFLRQTGWPSLALGVTAAALMGAPFASAGPAALSGLLEEGGEARFNDSFHWLVERTFAGLPGGAGNTVASLLALGVVVIGSLVAMRYATSPLAVLVAGSRVLGLYLLVAAAVQPWYVAWVAPLMAVSLQRGRGMGPFAFTDGLAWLWFGGTAVLTDLTYLPGGSGHWPWIRAVEYLPVYVVLVLAVIAWRRQTGIERTQ
ncbi:MAG: hypothetical protein HY534_04125 [Chloroflexi bacterium]|nr:hypothetical protein [Chloroflexota bacterium]